MTSTKMYSKETFLPAPETPDLESEMNVRLDEAVLDDGIGRQDDGGRIAAGVGDEARGADAVGEELRQPVDGRREVGKVRVLMLVPLGVKGGVLEAVIGGEVDYADALG